MKKNHNELLAPKLPELKEKIRNMLNEEGLGDFDIQSLLFFHKDGKPRIKCADPNNDWCLVPVPGGLKWKCLPKGSC